MVFWRLPKTKKRLRCEKFSEEMEKSEEMEQVVPWDKFEKEIEPFYEEKATGGKRMNKKNEDENILYCNSGIRFPIVKPKK